MKPTVVIPQHFWNLLSPLTQLEGTHALACMAPLSSYLYYNVQIFCSVLTFLGMHSCQVQLTGRSGRAACKVDWFSADQFEAI